MDVAALPRALVKHWKAAIATFLLISLGTLLAATLPAPRYQATTVVSVQPGGPDVSTQLLDYLLPSLQARIDAFALYNEVGNSLPAALREAEWTVETSVPAGSGVMYITVTSEERQLPVAAANTYARLLAAQDLGTTSLDVVVIDRALQVVRVSGRTTILVSGFGLAVLATALVALARDRWGRPAADASPARGPVAVSGATGGRHALDVNASNRGGAVGAAPAAISAPQSPSQAEESRAEEWQAEESQAEESRAEEWQAEEWQGEEWQGEESRAEEWRAEASSEAAAVLAHPESGEVSDDVGAAVAPDRGGSPRL